MVDQSSNLVVVFREGATRQEISKAISRRLFVENNGYYFMPPGVRSLVEIDVRGHDAYVISFNGRATEALRETIRAEMASSPGVLRVFVNTAPGKIVL